ncbi:MAG TPA: hypothetical protein H9871_01030 [Candidatus Nesterenkonia stercoripullorum]|uniref:Endonuclease/exonuclease/phosphatase domain-containing protein n=1 Tax=Candidatus Nesterenkonia stercoripullorum TaxID=2838701 RepID=A0A9D1S0N9_9MICC|nr:hypothetical protein [Candidatus Nesterenkonia stercoripullorum]
MPKSRTASAARKQLIVKAATCTSTALVVLLGITAGAAADFTPEGAKTQATALMDPTELPRSGGDSGASDGTFSAGQPQPTTAQSSADDADTEADVAGDDADAEGAGSAPADSPGDPLDVTVEKSSDDIRVGTVRAGMTSSTEEELLEDLGTGVFPPARSLAEAAQLNRPDVLLVTGITSDGDEEIAETLRSKYFEVGQNGQEGLDYPYVYAGPSNSGNESGADLDGDGVVGGPGDSIGYGEHPGQHGMILFSSFPIEEKGVRTFQEFLWEDLPDSAAGSSEYSDLERSVMRLTSAAFWDVPLTVDAGEDSERTVNVVASSLARPQDPADVDADRGDDERRMIADYLAGEAWYLTDDDGDPAPGTGSEFVYMGEPATQYDLPGSANEDLAELLDSQAVQDPEPEAVTEEPLSSRSVGSGGSQSRATRAVDDGMDVRSAFILPGASMDIGDSGVFWPAEGEYGADLVQPGSDQAISDRLVWLDIPRS